MLSLFVNETFWNVIAERFFRKPLCWISEADFWTVFHPFVDQVAVFELNEGRKMAEYCSYSILKGEIAFSSEEAAHRVGHIFFSKRQMIELSITRSIESQHLHLRLQKSRAVDWDFYVF